MEQIFMCVCCQELAFQPITTVCSHNVCKVRSDWMYFQSQRFKKNKQTNVSLRLCESPPPCSLSLPRLVSSGRSERRCTPARPAATTWAKTTSWPKTWRFSCCLTSSFPATARAGEVKITFISRNTYTHAHKHPFCAPTYTVKYLELHFKTHCAHILYLPTGKCILHIQPFMYTIIHTQTTSVGTDLICWAWTVSINITSPKFNLRHFF